MTQFKGKTRQEVFNEGYWQGYAVGFKDGYKKKGDEASEAVALIEKAYEDGVQAGWEARKHTEKMSPVTNFWDGRRKKKMTTEEIDKEFYKFWNGEDDQEGAERVYSYVDPGTARALFAEGWVRAEERKKKND